MLRFGKVSKKNITQHFHVREEMLFLSGRRGVDIFPPHRQRKRRCQDRCFKFERQSKGLDEQLLQAGKILGSMGFQKMAVDGTNRM